MITGGSVPALTSVDVGNLPLTVDEDFLSTYFRSRLDPSVCDVTLVRSSNGEYKETYAIIDLGSYIKAQEAIRVVNDKEIDGKRISVSLYIPSFHPLPGMKVYLKNIPDGIDNNDIYDLLTEFGTIISIELVHQGDASDCLHTVCITFLKEEDAQCAITTINSSRRGDNAIIAECDRNYIPAHAYAAGYRGVNRVGMINESIGMRQPTNDLPQLETPQLGVALDLSSITSKEEKTHAVKEYLFDVYKEDVKPRSRLRKVLDLLGDSLDPEHMLEHCTNRTRFQLYMYAAEDVLNKGQLRIQQLSPAALKVAEDMGLAGKSMNEKLQVIREYLYYEGIRTHPDKMINAILDKIVPSTDFLQLLELCADKDRFRLAIFHARVAMAMDKDLGEVSISAAANELIFELSLDKLGSVSEWAKTLRDHLSIVHDERYGKEHLEMALNGLFDSIDSPSRFYKLLEICADVHRFSVYAIVAEIAIEKNCVFFYDLVLDCTVSLVRQLSLHKLGSVDAWNHALREHMMTVHRDQYGEERLQKMLDKVFGSVTKPYDYYGILKACSNGEEFKRYS